MGNPPEKESTTKLSGLTGPDTWGTLAPLKGVSKKPTYLRILHRLVPARWTRAGCGEHCREAV